HEQPGAVGPIHPAGAAKCRPRPRLPVEKPGSMINYLETAAGIGRELVDQTGGAEGTWDGDCIVGAPGGGHRVQRQHVGHDLYGGSAGIGLVLSYLAAATGDSDFAQVGVAAVQHSL